MCETYELSKPRRVASWDLDQFRFSRWAVTWPADGEHSGAGAVRPLFLSVPVWDISEDEISEWKQMPGRRLAAYTAECIRDGKYDNGQEIYPYPESAVYRELPRAAIDEFMGLLAERGMARKSKNGWHAIAPGRLEPSMWRAVGVLLARRAELPPALAAELESWKLALYALNAPRGTPAGQAADQAAVARAVRPAKPALAIAAG
jgi:hypothetical protein